MSFPTDPFYERAASRLKEAADGRRPSGVNILWPMSNGQTPSPGSDSLRGDLFIVDNSDSGWTGLRYLEEWTDIAHAFDIATGFFEIGSLLALDGRWQKLDGMRILMGSETTARSRKLIRDAVTAGSVGRLDQSLEDVKKKNPFLRGVDAVVAALQSGQVECRVYDRAKFHAKAYITHGRLDVVGSQALVGSSNFTHPGLTQNIELNIQIQSRTEVEQLQRWFEAHWDEAVPINDAVIDTIVRHAREFSPFEVYAKALQEFFRGHELTASEWDESRSRVFPQLDRYQQEAYSTLLKIARRNRGAFLCDGVGLGKTFVGLMLIERLIDHEGKRVVLFAPKAAKEAVWDPLIAEHLGHLGGGGDFSDLVVFSHTDLNRKGDFPERFRRIASLADAFIVDEAHHFRNPGRVGEGADGRESRYRRLFNLLDPAEREKLVFLLTATPINNRLSDFRHMVELFSRKDESYFAQTLGINNLQAHFAALEKELREGFEDGVVAETEAVTEAEEILQTSETFKELVVQRSRAYAVASQKSEKGSSAVFPERRPPKVAKYSIRRSYGQLLDDVEAAFSKDKPLFSLAIYYPLAYYVGPDDSVDPAESNRQYQVVGLIRTNFLKRFESSVWAFERSCDRLLKKLLAFTELHSESDAERKRLERWKLQNAEVLGYAAQLSLEPDEEAEADEDLVPAELLASLEPLDRALYKVDEILDETFLDLDQIVRFIAETRKFEPRQDDKLQKLIRLLKSKGLDSKKVLIFSEFSDTARYVAKHLQEAGIERVEEIDSGTDRDRSDVIRRFAPYYNGSNSQELGIGGEEEIQVLVSTDVLSEGLNLQDATRLVNYDIHWNPVRLMQRIGRIDRRMNLAVEERLVADHPELAGDRGAVEFWNFLPPEELNEILTLFAKVTQKTILISKTLGIEGALLTPQDEFETLKEFNEKYEGTTSAAEELHLEYQALISEHEGLQEKIAAFPIGIFSGRKRPDKGRRGVFFCFALPALDKELNEFSTEAGMTRWYFLDSETDTIVEDPGEIAVSIRSTSSTPALRSGADEDLIVAREKVLAHIKDSYLKRIDAPVGVNPILKCWLEVCGE